MKKSIEKKLQESNPEFVAEVASLSSEEINSRIAQIAKDIDAINDAKDEDHDLEEARSNVSGLLAPYTESKKALGMKSKYLINLLKDRGIV